ncbi:MAG: methionine synthase [Ruminococcaceae bacterium]|nr:methionine synthase [Oscillospiraceae bacterium]
MLLDREEALRCLGAGAGATEELCLAVEAVARSLEAAVQPAFVYRVFDLERRQEGLFLRGAEMLLPGELAETVLKDCTRAALLACTVGSRFDALLLAEQARDMSRAVMLDACGSALVEAGCDEAERQLAARLPGSFLTDRFSPGYGDLPLELQRDICAVLDARRRLGLHVTDSLLLNPVKSVTAVIGIAERPQPARIRGCAHCPLRERCTLRKGGNHCGL